VRAAIFLRMCFILERACSMGFYGPGSRTAGRSARTKELLYELPYPLWSVRAKVVHHHNLSWAQCGSQYPLHVSLEHSGGGCPFHG
jgi:hypothetical protein